MGHLTRFLQLQCINNKSLMESPTRLVTRKGNMLCTFYCCFSETFLELPSICCGFFYCCFSETLLELPSICCGFACFFWFLFIIVVDLKVSWMLLIQWQSILETTAFLEYIKSNVKTNIRFHGSLVLWMFNNIDIMAITFAIAHTIKRYLSVLLHHN